MTFAEWLRDLETRHLADLRFAEVTRALRAVSAGYVERRDRLGDRSVLATAGKRAAYALYYAPLHFMTVEHVVRALPSPARLAHLLDCGCGTGAASAAWARAMPTPPHVTAVDRDAWALGEASKTYRTFAIDADVKRADIARLTIPRSVDALLAGWAMNELEPVVRDQFLSHALDRARHGCTVLVVEPIATRVSPWWSEWAERFRQAGGRADEWKFRVTLPDLLRRLDKAAGLRHDVLSARTLFVTLS